MKLKTNKSAKKRYKFSAKKKVMRRSPNLNHFNSKDSGGERRGKRGDRGLDKTNAYDLNRLFPYTHTS